MTLHEIMGTRESASLPILGWGWCGINAVPGKRGRVRGW